MIRHIRACLDSPQIGGGGGVPFDLAPFPDQTEVSAFETYQIASVLLRFKRPIQA